LGTVILIFVVFVAGIFLFFYLALPNTIILTSGPKGSISYKPLYVFYRNKSGIERLSQFAGQRIA